MQTITTVGELIGAGLPERAVFVSEAGERLTIVAIVREADGEVFLVVCRPDGGGEEVAVAPSTPVYL